MKNVADWPTLPMQDYSQVNGGHGPSGPTVMVPSPHRLAGGEGPAALSPRLPPPLISTPMQTVCNTYNEMPGEAIWRHTMQENASAAVALPRTPLEELIVLPRLPSWWEGAGCPSPKTPPPLLVLWASPRLSPTPA